MYLQLKKDVRFQKWNNLKKNNFRNNLKKYQNSNFFHQRIIKAKFLLSLTWN